MSNNPIAFRPNDEDLRILDAIRSYLTGVTKFQTYYNGAIRHALRVWEEDNLKKRDQAWEKLPEEDK
jgi:hypothetical protein